MDEEKKNIEETLQSIDDTLKRIEKILGVMQTSQRTESSEEFYKRHGITYSVG